MSTKYLLLILGVLVAGIATVLGSATALYAQSDPCATVITELQQTILDCSKINANWACYGHSVVDAKPASMRFQKPRHSRPLPELESITTRYRDGAALLKLQLLGENAPMTAMLFGGAELSPQGNDFFLLHSNGNQLLCADTPPSLVVRTASGEQGQLTVNGVQITLGSTVVLALRSPEQLEIANVEGSVRVSVAALGVDQPLAPGEGVQVIQDNGIPSAVSPPGPLAVATSAVMQWLATDAVGLPAVTEPACGGAIAYGQTLAGQTFTPSEECLYTFQGAVGDVVTIALETTAGELDPWVDLRGPNLGLVKFNNDAALDDADSLICNRGLPSTGRYTIVARPHDNDSSGSFQVTLNRATGCTPPPAQCAVVAPRLVVRSHPSVTAAGTVIALRQGTRLQPIRHSDDGQWLEVTMVSTGETGWVTLDHTSLLCTDEEVPPPVVAAGPVCVPERPPGWVDYRVVAGDTLSRIAARTGTTVKQLLDVNCLPNTMIRVGQLLWVPAPLCPAMTMTEFAIDPARYIGGATVIHIEWAASGGCDPVTGNLTVRSMGSHGDTLRRAVIAPQVLEERYPLNQRSGSIELENPNVEGCRLTAEFVLTLADKSGRSTTAQQMITLYDYCEPDIPTPTETPTVTVTATPTTTVCTALGLSPLSVDPGSTAIFVGWDATGGCDPVAGVITVVYSDSAVDSEAYPISGRSGSTSIPFPASTVCPLTGNYTLQLTDSSGQSASASRSEPLRDNCVVNTPVETPTPEIVVTTAPTTTVVINSSSVVTDMQKLVVATATPTPPVSVAPTVTPVDAATATPAVDTVSAPPTELPSAATTIAPGETPTPAAATPLPTETPMPPEN